jgi:hypothetical protein
MLRVKVVKLSKTLKKNPHHQQRKLKINVIGYQKGRMKKRLIVMQKRIVDMSLFHIFQHIASESVRLIDSGSSFHMISHHHWLSVYEKYNGGVVYLGDESPLGIVGHGRVLIRFHNGRVKGIIRFFHIMGLLWNLLSIRKLNDVGVHVVFSKKRCYMVRGDMVLTIGQLVWIVGCH